MKELLQASFLPVNLPATLLMIFVVMYWIVFLFGFLDLKSLHFDLDVDVDADVDLDMDVDVDADVDVDVDADMDADADTGHGGASGLKGLLSFLNVGSVPFMVWLSIFAFFYWTSSLLLNHYFPGVVIWMTLGMLLGAIIVSLLITKILTWPLKKVFKHLNDEAKPLQITGKLCKITISPSGDRIGQASYVRDHDPILIKVISHKGEAIPVGNEAIILEHNKEDNIYLVEPFNID